MHTSWIHKSTALWSAMLFAAMAVTVSAQQQQPFSADAELTKTATGNVVLTVKLAVAPRHYLYADHIEVRAEEGIRLTPLAQPKPKEKHDVLLGETVAAYDRDTILSYRVEGGVDRPFKLEVSYQGCSDAGVCHMPQTDTFMLDAAAAGQAETAVEPAAVGSVPDVAVVSSRDWNELAGEFTLRARRAGYLPSPDFIAFLDASESGHEMEENDLRDVVTEKGLWMLIALILVGGLALNLTPCVLPMIPINIAIIGAGAQAGSKKRGFLLGGLYGTGIALVYGALGLLVVLTGATFGSLNASPWFNLAIAILFALLALAMFDVFTIDFSRFQGTAGGNESKRGRFLAALGMGGVAALLAGACVAPVVISVLLLSADLYAGGNSAGLLLPFILGVGMALPWPFAGAGLSFLPKPGSWMTRVKMAFGVFILLFAIWYGFLGLSLLRTRTDEPATGSGTEQAGDYRGWQTSLAPALEYALQKNMPVFIDFWATWCKNCLRMDSTTFKDPRVMQRLDRYVRVKFQAENINAEDTKRVLDYFGVIGLPTYVILEPKTAETSPGEAD